MSQDFPAGEERGNSPVAPKKFLTNEGQNTLSERLATILPKTHEFDSLVGYFYISGFHLLYPALEPVSTVRILIGLKNDKVLYELMQTASEAVPSTAEVRATFGVLLKQEFQNAADTFAVETGVTKFIEWIKSGKLEVRLYKDQNIHAKVYIMTPDDPMPSVNHGYVITGSSNFSRNGLQGNMEFNVLLNEPEDHDYALYRFNELWKDSVDVKDVHETILQVVEEESPYAHFTPYELYLKFLAEYFRDYLGDRSDHESDFLPEGFKKLKYQDDAVSTAQRMLKEHGGVFLSDVVGLGKTYMAVLLALRLDVPCLVIAPPSLLDERSPGSWRYVFREFGIRGYKCESIGKLQALIDEGTDRYQYVIVDESHRFAGDWTQRYELLTQICQNKGVILVSATPYNNTPHDIFSQLKLFQPARKSNIPGLSNLEGFFRKLEKRIEGLHRLDNRDEYLAAVKQNSQELRERVLKHVMVRRTRSEIEAFYRDDLDKQKIWFPKVKDPIPLFYQLSRRESELFDETLKQITKGLHYARYQPLNPDYYTGSEESTAQVQKNLAKFMKIMMVKRFESSFHAFQETVGRFIRSHKSVLKAFDEGAVYTSEKSSAKLLDLLEDGDDEAVERLIEEEKAVRYDADEFDPKFRRDVAADLKILEKIQRDWEALTRDPKWVEFKERLKNDFARGKIIVFTEFADTANFLAGRIRDEVEKKTLAFSSVSSAGLRRDVILNFDANSKEQNDDYRILVTTDVLAEGVNLHRSDTVINYDIPWNPSRLMQRVGRVNRVGTKFKTLKTYNFFPTEQGDTQIALTDSARSKIHAFISLLGNDARLLTGDEEIATHNLFDTLNSKEAAEGDGTEEKSELKYLRQILDVKEKQPELFRRIVRLPRKARSSRERVAEPAAADGTVGPKRADRPAVITYFRQDRLDKFYRSHENASGAEELDFFAAAESLEARPAEERLDIPPERFYPLLDKNKAGFADAISPGLDSLSESSATATGNEAIVLKRLKDRKFRTADAISPDDKKFVAAVAKIIGEGRVGKATVRKVKERFDRTDDPAKMVAILRKEIAPQYLLPAARVEKKSTSNAPREVILSSYLH